MICILMDTDKALKHKVKYVKQMNLNCIRGSFWGKDHKNSMNLCDEHGSC